MPKPPPTSGVMTRILSGGSLSTCAADDVADDVAALAAERQRIALTVVFRDHAAGIDVIGDQTLVDDLQRDLTRGLRKGRFRGPPLAQRRLESEIARPVGPDLRRAGRERRLGADHMRQRLPVDRDRLGGILRRIERIGDHEGDRITDVTHHFVREHRIGRHDIGVPG